MPPNFVVLFSYPVDDVSARQKIATDLSADQKMAADFAPSPFSAEIEYSFRTTFETTATTRREALESKIESSSNYIAVKLSDLSKPESIALIRKKHAEGEFIVKSIEDVHLTSYFFFKHSSKDIASANFRPMQDSEPHYLRILLDGSSTLTRLELERIGFTKKPVLARDAIVIERSNHSLSIGSRAELESKAKHNDNRPSSKI